MSEQEKLFADIIGYIQELEQVPNRSNEEQKKLETLYELRVEVEQTLMHTPVSTQKEIIEASPVATPEDDKAPKTGVRQRRNTSIQKPVQEKEENSSVTKGVRVSQKSAPEQKASTPTQPAKVSTPVETAKTFIAEAIQSPEAKKAVEAATTVYTQTSTKVRESQLVKSAVASVQAQGEDFFGLYTLSLIVEAAVGLVRFILSIVILGFFALIFGVVTATMFTPISLRSADSLLAHAQAWLLLALVVSLWFGFGTVINSIIASVIPFVPAGAKIADQIGAREPTKEEKQKVTDILASIGKKYAIYTPLQDEVYILENVVPNAYSIGTSLFLTSGLFNSDFLGPAIAHELGHIQHGNAKQLLAIRRFIRPLAYWIGIDRQIKPGGVVASGNIGGSIQLNDDSALYYRLKAIKSKFLLGFLFGGLSVVFLSHKWAGYWKHQDYRADNLAVKIGYKRELIAYLEEYKDFDVAIPYGLSLRAYTALRLERIRDT